MIRTIKLMIRRELAWLKWVSAENNFSPMAPLHKFEFDLACENVKRWRNR